jgi:uncharacterized protein (TIGR02266 family)
MGAHIALKLYLPGLRDGAQTQAVVRELAPPGKESGFWAEFVDLGNAELAHISEAIDRRQRAAGAKPIGAVALQPAEDPRRAFPRVTARFAVRFTTFQDFVLEYAANISAGGVFVNSEDPPLLETIVKVVMDLPGISEPVHARGRVVHRVSKEEAAKRGVQAGMGVQFVDATDEFRGQIDAALDFILKQNG